ncbi:MAG: phosphorylated CTD-interacting factor 1 [Bacillariaceae sp.]|jgi:phosphorylated CTD-interacting factor 1
MPKKRRKIQDVNQLSNLSNLTGFGNAGFGGASSSLDDCLAEMSNTATATATTTTATTTTISDCTKRQDEEQQRKQKQPSWVRQAKTSTAEGIYNWNRNFQIWAKGGIYHPGLLPNIDQEIARNFKVQELSTLLLSNEFVKGKDIRMTTFERWLLDSKHEEEEEDEEDNSGGGGDPVLPLRSSPDSKASQRLLSELITCSNHKNNKKNTKNIPRKDAETIIAKLCRTTNLTCQELLCQEDRYRKQSPLNKGDRINVSTKTTESSNVIVVSILYSRKRWKKPFCFKLNQNHYKLLKNRFMEIHSPSSSPLTSGRNNNIMSSSDNTMTVLVERSFHVLVLALLLRYSALSGGQLLDDLRGGGMQGAIHSSVFDVLQSHFSKIIPHNKKSSSSTKQFWLEGFASPFNATLPRFASAFPDLDWHFGSVGRFLDCSFDGRLIKGGGDDDDYDNDDDEEEYCEANPPFTPGIMLAMADHTTKVLQRADMDNTRLTFVVVVPSADNKKKSNKDEAVVKHEAQKSFRSMVSSVYCTKHIQLKAREHGYVEGAQHLRPTQYKQSSYDTSVIILQSPKAKRYGLDKTNMEQLEKDLRIAFASRHENEIMERKKMATSAI